ncbi:PREDICTED: outer dense fiber protein 4 [Elephantulus edwardii]|uniref:outer dense fiber protein 4 n=1 Tax=Elephantulus edwardii TaxID=28737 RepID=UPI0003F0EE6B|nr:PREDICTED: outer dense fiber protein 4 [Elephantulus edwardii]
MEQLVTLQRRGSQECLRQTSSFRKMQVLTSELSLAALSLLLLMAFSKNWLYPAGSRFFQYWPANVSAEIHTYVHIMSMGFFLDWKSHPHATEYRKDIFKQWKNQPFFELAKLSFFIALGLGFVLTAWLHLPYLPVFQRLPAVGWTGTIMSICEVTFVFFTLMLFPINLWIFEWKRNLSIPIGWSYFIGWLTFSLYIICAVLCYFNQRNLQHSNLTYPFGSVSCSSTFPMVKKCLKENTDYWHPKILRKKMGMSP